MHKYVLATAFVLAMARPALAAEFYVALDTSTKQCRVMATQPDGIALKQVGNPSYPSMGEAQQAIQALPECTS